MEEFAKLREIKKQDEFFQKQETCSEFIQCITEILNLEEHDFKLMNEILFLEIKNKIYNFMMAFKLNGLIEDFTAHEMDNEFNVYIKPSKSVTPKLVMVFGFNYENNCIKVTGKICY